MCTLKRFDVHVRNIKLNLRSIEKKKEFNNAKPRQYFEWDQDVDITFARILKRFDGSSWLARRLFSLCLRNVGQSGAVNDPDRFRSRLFIGVSYRIEETTVTRTDRRTISLGDLETIREIRSCRGVPPATREPHFAFLVREKPAL